MLSITEERMTKEKSAKLTKAQEMQLYWAMYKHTVLELPNRDNKKE